MHPDVNKTYTESRGEVRVSRFHTRQALSILVVFAVLVATFFIMLAKQYDLAQKHEKEILLRHFNERVAYLENLLSVVTDHVDGMRVVAEADFLETSAEPVLNQPLEFNGLEDVAGENCYHLEAPEPPITREMIGNLTGEGSIHGRDRDFYREIHMALTLNPQFRVVANSIKNAAWVYYTSRNNFLNIYPWVSSGDFRFTTDLQSHEFYTLGLPENNPDREMFWTKVYVDEYGKGLMTTCAEPVYDGDRFVGTVAVDLTVDFLNTVVKKFNPQQGQMFLVNKQDQLLAHPTLITSEDQKTKPLSAALPEALKTAGIQLNSLPDDEFVIIGPYNILSSRLQRAPWQVIYLYPVGSFWTSLTNLIGPGPLIVLALLLLLVVAVLVITEKQFISPSGRFVNYIMARSQGATTPMDFGIPRVWKPWFAAVEKVFAENKELTQELQKQNENLENRVIQRTTELEKEIEDRKQKEKALRESEERNRTIIKTATDGFCIVDFEGNILEVNDAYCRMSGYTQQELLSMSISDLEAAETPNNTTRRIEKILERGWDCFESLQRRKDGTIFAVEISVTCLHIEGGRLVSFLHDITDRKKAEEAIKHQKDRLGYILEGTDVGTWEWNVQTGETILNERWANIIGYTLEEISPISIKKWTIFVHPDDMAARKAALEKHFQGEEERYEIESRMKHKDGHWVWFLDRGKVISWTPDGKPLWMYGTSQDITVRKRSEDALEQRIIALTQPLDTPEGILFEELFNLDDIQLLQDQFSQATGVASIITYTDGTPITQPSNFCRLCKDIIRNTEKGLLNCYKSDAALGRHSTNGPLIQPCLSGGLWDAGAGISVGGKHIANWLIGQVRDETQTEDQLSLYAREIGADEEKVIEAFREVPAMSREQFEAVSQALFTLANQLSAMAYQNVQQARFITERKRTDEERALNMQRAQALLQLNQMTEATLPEITDFALEEAVRLTRSKIGYLAFLNDDESILTMHSWSKSAMEECAIVDKPFHYPVVNTGLWGEAVRQRRAIITNDYFADNPWKKGFPSGHVSVFRHMNTPIFNGDKIVIVAGVGNKETEYNKTDVQQVSLIMQGMWRLIEKKRAEKEREEYRDKLAQAQKMKAIGTLAGGISHDFNNLLQVIKGYTELLLVNKDTNDKDYYRLVEIKKAGERAAGLVQQLLLFSRKKEKEQKPVDLNHEVNQTCQILNRIIPKMIEINLCLGSQLWIIGADPVQLEQILLNLGKNAADAMPDGGRLLIETENVILDKDYSPNHLEIPPGRYVQLTVSDTGHGMNRETLDKIFEPFYTTKEIGKGTGLGLASVYGIVKNHGGFINCYSEIGQGTIFKIYFPAIEQVEPDTSKPVEVKPILLGTETILLVDDEEAIRGLAQQALMDYGYKVMTASTGEEALEIYSSKSKEIDLIIMDLGMPGMGGHKCLQEILQKNPEIKIIIASGYSITGQAKKSLEAGAKGYLGKPYQLADLLNTVRAVLDDQK